MVAYQMKLAGHEVYVGVIEDEQETKTKEELKTYKSEDPKSKKQRLEMHDGLLDKLSAKKLLALLQKIPKAQKDEWFIFMDLNTCFKYGEALKHKGFMGNFPTEQDRIYEVNRSLANEFVSEHYPGIRVGDYHEFKDAKEGIDFLKDITVSYVLKSMGDSGDTIVAPDDPEAARELLSDQLKLQQKEYEQMGFILEEKIEQVIELTPQIIFFNGEPLYATLDIENKALGAGNIGPSMGCMQNLVCQTGIDDPINKLAFPEIVYDMAKQHQGISIFDISFLIDQKGVINFGEFCFNRFGWDACQTEMSMAGGVSEYFEALKAGDYPLKYQYGAGVRILNMGKHGAKAEGKLIEFDEKIQPELFLMDVTKDDKFRTLGWQWDQAVITGSGDTWQKAVERAYENCEQYHFVDKYYRSKEDFITKDYFTAIINRLDYATDHDYIYST